MKILEAITEVIDYEDSSDINDLDDLLKMIKEVDWWLMEHELYEEEMKGIPIDHI